MSNDESDEGNTDGKEASIAVTPIEKVTENYEKLKAANDKVEAELLRSEELKAKIALGGKSTAGQEEEEDPAKVIAEEIVNAFR